MHLFNKILLILIFLTGTFYFVLAANRYTLGKNWEEKIEKQEKQIETVTASVEKLKTQIYGVPLKNGETWEWSKMGLIARNHKLDTLIPTKMWTNCRYQSAAGLDEAGKGNVSLSLTVSPGNARVYNSTPLSNQNLFFVFDSGTQLTAESAEDGNVPPADPANQKNPVFLGIFIAETIDPAAGAYTLRSNGALDEEQKNKIEDSIGNVWIMYEDRLPVDSPKDIAVWLREYPDDSYAKLLSDSEKNDLSRDSVLFPFESEESDLAKANSAEPKLGESYFRGVEETPESEEVAKGEMVYTALPEESDQQRYSVPYQAAITRCTYEIDKLTLLVLRAKGSKQNLNRVICDQLAMIGCEGIPGLDSDLNGVKNRDAMLAAYQAIADNEKEGNTEDETENIGISGLKSLLPQSVANFNAATFAEQENLTREKLTVMQSQRDIVKKRLDIAENSVKQMETRIDDLIKQNAGLAKEIADAQFEASDQILRRAGNVTALASPNSALGE